MGRTERLFRITSLMRDNKNLRFDEMLQRLSISPSTLKRDLKYLREKLGTPIEYDAFERTYKIGAVGQQGVKEMPGLWFSETELYALTFAHRLLEELDPNQKLAPRLKSVIRRVEHLVSHKARNSQLFERVRLWMPGKRTVKSEVFEVVTAALMQRRQVRVGYFSRSGQVRAERDVSPQRMVFSRTWYLDAWCHQANELRRFALDTVDSGQHLKTPAKEVSLHELERLFDGSYGTLTGEPNRWATMIFTEEAAESVEREIWHPMQHMRRLSDGQLELVVPFRSHVELVMDILRHGDQVLVVGDDYLQGAMRNRVQALSKRYELKG
jgi:predicted DNA-binding transcriptional regulator YafY